MMPTMQARLIGAALALLIVVGIFAGLFFWGRSEGVKADAKRTAPIIAGLQSDLKLCNANVDTLTATLEKQNSAVDALKAEADERTKRAREAIARAEQQAAHYRAKADRIAAATPGPDMCASARQLIVDSLAEDRK